MRDREFKEMVEQSVRAAHSRPCPYDTPYLQRTNTGGHELRWHPTPAQIIAKDVAEAIAADWDGKIRQALIDLGWTPPEDQR